MNKNKKKGLIAIAGIFILMMTAASVSAGSDDEPGLLERDVILYEDSTDSDNDDITSDEEPNLISPNPNDGDLGPLIIAPADSMEKQEQSSNIFTSNLMPILMVFGAIGIALGLIAFRKKK